MIMTDTNVDERDDDELSETGKLFLTTLREHLEGVSQFAEAAVIEVEKTRRAMHRAHSALREVEGLGGPCECMACEWTRDEDRGLRLKDEEDARRN